MSRYYFIVLQAESFCFSKVVADFLLLWPQHFKQLGRVGLLFSVGATCTSWLNIHTVIFLIYFTIPNWRVLVKCHLPHFKAFFFTIIPLILDSPHKKKSRYNTVMQTAVCNVHDVHVWVGYSQHMLILRYASSFLVYYLFHLMWISLSLQAGNREIEYCLMPLCSLGFLYTNNCKVL